MLVTYSLMVVWEKVCIYVCVYILYVRKNDKANVAKW